MSHALPTDSLPAAPARWEDTRLPFSLLCELVLKALHQEGQIGLWGIGRRLRLPLAVLEPVLQSLRGDGLVEVGRRGDGRVPPGFQLTGAGQAATREALARSQYLGPAPVSLGDYVLTVRRQSAAGQPVTRTALQVALADIEVAPELLESLGTAMNSGRPLLLHGPSGGGKTSLAERLARALPGEVLIPHAVLVDGEIMRVFDPLVHRPLPPAPQPAGLARPEAGDGRWVACHRPAVLCGGELSVDALDLQFDPVSRFYMAPPQVKANNGVLVIDDLGRQRSAPSALMNRWIVPLDRGIDHFTLHTGNRFALPFDLTVIFSTNLTPESLDDDAFMRRLGYKIRIGEMALPAYRRVFDNACLRAGLAGGDAGFAALLARHADSGLPRLACTPIDLLAMIRDRARFLDAPGVVNAETLGQAWASYFATSPASADRPEAASWLSSTIATA